MRDYRYYKEVCSGLPMPFAFVDLDMLQQNIQSILQRANWKKIRIASKSIRSVDVLRRILKANARFQGIMCFTVPEAVYLAQQGFTDLLLGYPAVDESLLASVAMHQREGGCSITLMVDCESHVEQAEAAAAKYGVVLPLCVDIDLSIDVPGLHFGVWRSPIRSTAAALDLIQRIVQSRHVVLEGLMGYEAQVAGLGDRVPRQALKNAIVRFLKRRSIREAADRRAELIAAIERMGLPPLRFVNAGGTGSLHTSSKESVVTEVTAGSGFYSPGLFDHYRDFSLLPAAGYAIEIVRQPRSDLYTCLGGGYTASGAAGNDKLPRPYLPQGAALLAMEGAGEVQTPIRYNGPEKLELGDPIFMRHSKAGELCERFKHLYYISNNGIVGETTTYRGDGLCYL
ncbi:amino acid deaminase/aldolase [Paenibacillus sp. Marseille-P2973]|uniref:amino acid deaminase/aldolase n=1 Tax=Paenibacillus sp. Marseille-P2973 TaxID=1871032 RepID=UPI001B39BD8A|nr:amino acid deaminase/aldolase [Paenibacillus sp. Marseille-P2973]MBQ4897747.1 amino acid deaminase/aldolase [Paenibacillus sp. Marseille-P2973]